MALCFAMTTTAETVDRQAALYTAQSFMLAKGKTVDATPAPSKSRRTAGFSTEDAQGQPYYYVFNAGNDGGYVIVSGDDRTEPILGYVEQGSFDPDNIPENMRSWLQLYADQIKFIVDNNIDPSSPILKKRNRVRATKHSIPEMLTTRWNQGRPYNLTCPDYYLEKDNDESTALPQKNGPATGCTATAMAQVLNFYRYPDKLKSAIPYYSITYTSQKNGSKKTVTLPTRKRNTEIDWDNMRDTYSWQDVAHANVHDTAVANLMLYCGQAVKMHYGPSSGANFSAEAYITYFGYDSRAYVGERRDYTIDDWFDHLYNEIEQGYPVLFSGFSSGGGHAFVLDGFDGDNLFHLNWGWGGGSNGWFLVSILNPGDSSGIGASSSSDGYSMSQRALFNLRIPGTPKTDAYLTVSDVTLTSTSVKANFTNRTGSTGSFQVAIVMENEDGELEVVGTKQAATSLAHGSTATKTFQISKKLPEGTYRLSPANKPLKGEEWKVEYDFQNQYINAEVDSAGSVKMEFAKPIPKNQSIEIDTIVFPGTRIAGQQQEVKVTYRNNGAEYYKEVRLFASQTNTKTYTDSRSMVAVRSGELVDVSYFFTPEETGTYNLWFCTGSDGSGQVGTGTMEVVDEAHAVKASLTISSYTINNLVSNAVYGKQLSGKVSIKNNAKNEFNGNIKLQIWSQKVGENVAWSGSTKTCALNVMAGKIGSVDFSFDNLNEGYYYHIKATYANQDGELGGGGIWSHSWEMKSGILIWKSDGTTTGKAYMASMSPGTIACGVLADCSKNFTRFTPNRNNPNAIYAFGSGMTIPSTLDGFNVVNGNRATSINLTNDKPFVVPATFDADSASFTYTFPETEDGSGWHAFTMPFEADSIFVDSVAVELGDSLNHFWIYEFAAQGNKGEVIFAPAKVLRGNTPYIIAADSTMAGRSIVFRSLDVPFYKAGSDKMVVTSPDYKFHGNTCSPKLKDCYVLNGDGTAFEYVTTFTVLPALSSYFTTSLDEETRLPSIVLPSVPLPEVIKQGDLNGDNVIDIADAVSILDIMAAGGDAAGTAADLNGDGVVDIADFVMILDMMAGE